MSIRTYITTSLFVGVLAYFVFPIDEPTLMYFFGTVLGVLLPMLPYQNKWLHSSIVYGISSAILLILFPVYLVAGMTIGYGVHLVLDMFTEKGSTLLYPFVKKDFAVKLNINIAIAEKIWLLIIYVSLTAIGVISLFEKFAAS